MIVKLGNHIKLVGGGTPSKEVENYWNGGIPWVSVKDLKDDFVYTTSDSISEEGLSKSSSKLIPAGTLLIATRMAVGRVSFPKMDVAINQDLKAIFVDENIDSKFLFYKLKSKEEYFNRVATGATVKGIKIEHITDLEIPLPPLAEQKRIADLLDAADALRKKDQALLEKYDQLAQSLFLEMFGDPGIKFHPHKNYTFDDIAVKITDGDHATPIRSENGYKLLSCRNVKQGYIDFNAGLDYVGEQEFQRMYKRCNPEKGDILISCSGTIGRTTEVKIDEPFVLVRSAALIKPKKNLVNSTYLEKYLQTAYMQALMQKNANSSSQANLFTGQIKSLPILLPELEIQNQFAEQVQLIEKQKEIVQENLKKSEELMKSCMQNSFKVEY